MKKRFIQYLFIFIFSGITCFLLRIAGMYIIDRKEESEKIEWLKKKSIDGVIGANLYLIEDQNYDYLTYDFDFVLGKYFFENNKIKNLQLEDSVSKKTGKLVLEIYRKDENGKYQYIGNSR